MDKRQLLIDLYERNMNLVFSFRDDYGRYLEKNDYWNEVAFADARITHKQYYDELIRISEIEYSQVQYSAIKTIEIQSQFLDEYIAGINQQYDNLSLVYEDLKLKSKF